MDTVSDSGLQVLRSRLSIPVVGPGQVAFHLAGILGQRFSVVTMWDTWGFFYRKLFKEYGLTENVASVRAVNIPPDVEALLAGKEDEVFQKLTEEVDGKLRFVSVPPLLTPLHELYDAGPNERRAYVLGLLEQYIDGLHADRQHLVRSYEVADMARKVVGIGSVGTRAWVILLVGRGGQDAVMLQAKEAQASVLEAYLGRSEYATHGERVVRGQRMMQAATDIFLSWQRSPDLEGVERDFYVRQLWDWKASADLSRMTEHGLLTYTRACAWSLARSHARSGDRLAIAAYLGKGRSFDRAIARFASLYADQNECDHRRLREAVDAGEIEAAEGI